jgi:hypothetical protein
MNLKLQFGCCGCSVLLPNHPVLNQDAALYIDGMMFQAAWSQADGP